MNGFRTYERDPSNPKGFRIASLDEIPPDEIYVLDTETTAEGDVVLKAGQTPQDSPDTADFSISSMGFDGQGRFHIRLTMAEGFTGDGLLAVPYDAGDEQMGSTLERIAVDGGMSL